MKLIRIGTSFDCLSRIDSLLLQDDIWIVRAQIGDVVQFFNSSNFCLVVQENVEVVVQIETKQKIECGIRNQQPSPLPEKIYNLLNL